MTDIYEALVQLQYPKITLVNSKDVESQILTGENRISLLSWLLQQNQNFTFPLLNKLQGPALEEELFKYYSQIGICNDKEKLLGKCSFKNQLSTLKLLLLFMRNINASPKIEEEINNLPIIDTLKEYFEKDVNILPDDFSISTKLTQAETNKYIEDTRQNVKEVKTRNSDAHNESLPNKQEISTEEKLRYLQEVKNEKCTASLEKFIECFKNLEFGSKALQSPLQNSFNMNENILNIHSNFSTIKQALDCKDEILHLSIPTGLKTLDTPLTETIDDSVFWLQRVYNAQAEENDL